MVKLSIVTTIYNNQNTIMKAYQSLLTATRFEEIEWVCVNDGSKDYSSDLIKGLSLRHSNITVIEQDNHGFGHALMTGFRAAKGEYVRTLDSDDTFEHLDKLLEVLDCVDVDMVISPYRLYLVQEEKFAHTNFKYPEQEMTYEEFVRQSGHLPTIHSITFKKSLLDDIDLYDRHFIDVELINKLPVQTIYYLDCEIMTYYLGQPHSCMSNLSTHRLDYPAVAKRLLAFYEHTDKSELLKDYLLGSIEHLLMRGLMVYAPIEAFPNVRELLPHVQDCLDDSQLREKVLSVVNVFYQQNDFRLRQQPWHRWYGYHFDNH